MPAHRDLDFRGGVAVITGAASGIGAALALQLATRGCHLALVDVNDAGLQVTAAQAGARGITVSRHVLDLAQPESAAELLAAVNAAHGRVRVLVNNAGVALGGNFEQVAAADFDWLMSINFGAVVRLSRAFLPLLTAGRQPAAERPAGGGRCHAANHRQQLHRQWRRQLHTAAAGPRQPHRHDGRRRAGGLCQGQPDRGTGHVEPHHETELNDARQVSWRRRDGASTGHGPTTWR